MTRSISKKTLLAAAAAGALSQPLITARHCWLLLLLVFLLPLLLLPILPQPLSPLPPRPPPPPPPDTPRPLLAVGKRPALCRERREREEGETGGRERRERRERGGREEGERREREDLEFRVQGLGFRISISGLECRV